MVIELFLKTLLLFQAILPGFYLWQKLIHEELDDREFLFHFIGLLAHITNQIYLTYNY